MIRVLNIGLRTAHLAAMGVLLGGHAFAIAPERLTVSLGLTLGTGAALAAVETGGRVLWLHQGRGLMTPGKRPSSAPCRSCGSIVCPCCLPQW
jgi:hypothetical protein